MAVIPARLASTRLPRKALADICGEPMIARVARRVLAARGLDAVLVATDSEEIAQAARRTGVRAVMTSPACATGTDRIAEVAADLDADLILNIQGDEPLLPPAAVEALAQELADGVARGREMATLARPLEPGEEDLPQVVKVVLAEDGTAMYFSRSSVPHPRNPGACPMLAHVGLYGYTRSALLRLARLAPTGPERAEGLEQLRALGHGIRIGVSTGPWRTLAVDTPEDLERVRARFRTDTLTGE